MISHAEELVSRAEFQRRTEANEKHITVEERERMVQAKVAELQNFFNNQVNRVHGDRQRA